MPGWWLAALRGRGFVEHTLLGLHVDLEVVVGGVQVRVAEPVGDTAEVAARADQMHRRGVAQHVRREGLGLE